MLAEITAGLSSLQAAFNITKGLNAANTQASVNEVKIELQQYILEAQQALSAANDAQSSAAQRIHDLEQEIVRLKDWSTEKKRYELQDAGRGAIVYMPKPGMEGGEPPHWLCANCFNQGRKSFMQFKGQQSSAGMGGAESTYGCDACKASFRVHFRMNPERHWGKITGAPESS